MISFTKTHAFLLLFMLAVTLFAYSQNKTVNNDQSRNVLNSDVFNSNHEKELFKRIASGASVDYLSLYLVTDSAALSGAVSEKLHSRIRTFLSTAPGIKRNGNVTGKDLKKLYKDIHDTFLSQYFENPTFSQLFDNGGYNCATATALYTILLDSFSINYRILETPQHVYLIASPESQNVVFETTAPGMRAYQVNEKGKNQYLEYLYKNKIISKEEWASGNRNELFEKYYYSDESIDKLKLAGLLYYNRGVEAAGNEDFITAYRNFEKAYFLYPAEKMKYYVAYSLANVILSNGMMERTDAYPYLLRLLEVSHLDVGRGALLEYIEKISRKLLFQNPQPQTYTTVYQAIRSHITDSALVRDVSYYHYYNSAHYFSIKSRYDSALIYLDSVYELNSADLMVQELVTNTILEKMRSDNNEARALPLLKRYFVRYPFLETGGKLREYYAYCLSKLAGEMFQKNNLQEGDIYIREIKQLLLKEPDNLKNLEPYFVNAFVENFYYFMRHKNYKEAKSFLLSVNKFYPANDELKRRIDVINNILLYNKK